LDCRDNKWHSLSINSHQDIYQTQIFLDGTQNKLTRQDTFPILTLPELKVKLAKLSTASHDIFFYEGDIDELMIFNRIINFEEFSITAP
jgi:hypothetical protein